jgi:hypothetical protein
MLLNDLSAYAPIQNERINKLPLDAIGSTSLSWEAFREKFWGKPLESLEHEELVEDDPEPVPDVTLPEERLVVTMPPELLEEWGLGVPDGKFLVRSEYREAEREVLSFYASRSDVAVITGHPGIGSLPTLPTVCGT